MHYSKSLKKSVVITFLIFLNGILRAQPVGYYNGVEGKSGEDLKQSLNEIISDHVDFSYSFAKNIINYADADTLNPNNVILFYLQESRLADNYGTGGDNINREHVWAKSHGNFSGIRPMDSDTHNLHVADASVNVDRSNKDFDNIQPNGSQHPEALYCYYTDSTWEPGPKTKGQVARTLLYMATRYEGNNGEMDLELARHNHTYPDPLHGNLTALLEWNRNYPPSNFERRRNDRIYSIQGNRNPFVDHPEFADFIWNDSIPSAVQFSNFNMTPEFPLPGDEITIEVKIAGIDQSTPVSLLIGDKHMSDDQKISMNLSNDTYSTKFSSSQFSAGEMAYFTVQLNVNDSLYSWIANYTFPENISFDDIKSIVEVQGTSQVSPFINKQVTIAGRVTANFDYSFFMETEDPKYSGINVYNTLFRGKVGDSLIVRGTVDEYQNLTEIVDVSYIYNYHDNTEMTPKIITTNDFKEEYEGMLVTIENASFGNNAGDKINDYNSYTFSDQYGSAVAYVSAGSRIDGEYLPEGNCDITGILGEYNGTYQLLIRNKNDMKSTTSAGKELAFQNPVKVFPNPAKDRLYLKIRPEIEMLEIFNVNGQIFYRADKYDGYIDISILKKGVYFIVVTGKDKMEYQSKFLKY